jgi:hypothetical protein
MSTIKLEHFPTDESALQPPPPAAPATDEEEPADESEGLILGDAPDETSMPANNLEKVEGLYDIPTPEPLAITPAEVDDPDGGGQLAAPFVMVRSNQRNLLVSAAFGEGEIVVLSDPYIVSNGGLGLVDNARLAVNLVESRGGLIAFDEYHQGYGANNNRFLEFFAGTPVIAIFVQCVLIVGLLLYSNSRRFGRALPADEPDRLSKLEYVSAMAELQRRTAAYDLAIENIYRDFRRRASRLVGLDNLTASRQELAAKIGERANVGKEEIEDLLFRCEDIIAGEPTNKRQTLDLITRIREIESRLGIRKVPKG